MSSPSSERPLLAWAVMLAACVGTVVFALASVRTILHHDTHHGMLATSGHERLTAAATPLGVRAVLTAGEVKVERRLPALSFVLRGHESLDPHLPAGPFRGIFQVRFQPGTVRHAKIGAELRGGSLIVRRGDEVLLTTYAGEATKSALSTLPIALSRRGQDLVFEFEADDSDVHALRAVWQPDDSAIPLPLPSLGAPLLGSETLVGEQLVQELNCVACHPSAEPRRQQRLAASPGPLLGDLGARAHPAWIRSWLADPDAVKPGTLMPRLLPGEAAGSEMIEDLTHFLVAMGGPLAPDSSPPSNELIVTGRKVYHEVGCVACHGPLESPESLGLAASVRSVGRGTFEPHGNLAAKTDLEALARFLEDPLASRPSGRMPDLDLSAVEAEAVAAYLIARDAASGAVPAPTDFSIDAARAERGRAFFGKLGCANCHELGPNRTPVEPLRHAPPLESLAGSSEGCLSDQPSFGVPRFDLSERQRQSIAAYLADLSSRRNEHVPLDDLALAAMRLDCVACHEVYGTGGADPSILAYFTTRGEADLGDEGRLPPSLTDAGARLNRPWLREVLEGDGRARPYLATRMPKFGESNVEGLTEALLAAAGVTGEVDEGPAFDADAASVGRELVGAKGMNCIQCHDVAGRPATGTPGPDLAEVAGRLRYASFSRWLHDPANVRPGTRMPSFFVGGYSGFTDFYGGAAQEQVDAIWSYLSQGEHLPLPEGLTDLAGLELVVSDEPVVFRTFMEGAGVRAIAVGFPQQIHFAWDADECRLALAWQGQFLNAAGAWAARGGSETNPHNVVWTAPGRPLLAGPSSESQESSARRFRGYRLDAGRRPIFLYDVDVGPGVVHVEDQPRVEATEAGTRLRRQVEIRGEPGARVVVDPAGHRVIEAPGVNGPPDGPFEIVVGDTPVVLVLEVTW